MDSRRYLVTGASSGIGQATAAALASQGAQVIMVSRTQDRGERARQAILKSVPGAQLDLIVADLSTKDALHRLATTISHRYDRLDVLINNAAILTGQRRVTADGFEMQFFVNHLAYFMLTGLLLDLLRAGDRPRIVNIASTAHRKGEIHLDDFNWERRKYRGWKAYADTKLMNIMFTYELARRLHGTGVSANAVHPGVIHTNLLRNFSRVMNLLFHATQRFFKSPEEGAETSLHVATSPDVEGITGKYFRECQQRDTLSVSNDVDLQRQLWEVSERLTGCGGNMPAV